MRRTGNDIIVLNLLLDLLALACLPVGSAAQSDVKTRIPPDPQVTAPTTATKSSAKSGVKHSVPGAVSLIVTVTVRAETQVAGKTFTLGEIADIKGGDAALRKRLASVEIGAASLPGLSRQILPGDVTVHLRAAQCGDLLDNKRINLITPPTMQITRAGQDVTLDDISKAALAAAQPTIKDLTGATLESELRTGKVTLPVGKLMLVSGACQGQPEQGALHVPVSLIVDDKTVQMVDVTLKVHRRLTALVARHSIEPHDILTAADVVLSDVDLPSGFTQPIMDLSSSIGKRATRRIFGGMPVPADALEIPPDILANVRVTVAVAIGSITITMPGLTRQAGHIGEAIHVYIPDTAKELEAVVIDKHTVRVDDPDAIGN